MNITENDISILYLTYAHIMEQFILMMSLMKGFSHGYFSGDPLKLFDDMQALKPTFFATVPRILNRVHSKVMEGLNDSSNFKKIIFN